MPPSARRLSRRRFLSAAAVATAGVSIVPASVLGAPDHVPPSETLGGALIGVGGRGPGTYSELTKGMNVQQLALCDVKYKGLEGEKDGKAKYVDFRRVLDRKDIDLVAIGTPPHWHSLISIAAAEAGKDVLCEKPMSRTLAEGRAVANAFARYGRIFQIGTFGRFGASKSKEAVQVRKLMTSGLVEKTDAVVVRRGGFKVKEWSGRLDIPVAPVPANLDWDLYCGPAPLKPFVPTRVGGTHRWYWDYENGGMGDMGQHFMDPLAWQYGLDTSFPIEIEASAPPAHPEVTGMWAWVKLTYPNGFTLVLESDEWGEPSGLKSKTPKVEEFNPEIQRRLKEMPDPEPLLTFAEAVKARKPAGGNAEAAYRTVAILLLANIAIRTGRKIKFDPIKEEIIGDEEANRLVNPPMRAPWHL